VRCVRATAYVAVDGGSVSAKAAVLSDCGRYRYSLTRTWGDQQNLCCWIMLNPSTADAELDDPTIRKCIGFSQRWGHGGLVVVNLFAWRSTDPEALKRCGDPIGALNNDAIREAVATSVRVICAWGTHGKLMGRGQRVRGWFPPNTTEHIGPLSKDGHPKHPLYLPYELATVPW
jgi:hypothetical protein